ncbi:MAG TPA: RluA family pseudouridine synthase [Longimicrobiales bacterium]|nr:RluA family pseudouridine synthase [Longimicrobiales bacterium]
MTTGEGSGGGRVFRLEVEERPEETRLDAYLAARLPELSRSRVAQLLGDGRVRVDGALPRKSDAPVPGSVVEVELPAPTASPLAPADLPLDVRYEDADLLVLSKAAGMVVHPAPGHHGDTLVNALLHHVGDLSGIGGVLRPGIVHRLDKDTSGLMVVAKHDRAHRALAEALKRREVRRQYLAACWGRLPEDRLTVEAPIGRSPGDRTRMAVVESGGRRARTHLRRVERWAAAELIEARLDTGRTHQIRVHLAHLGHPVVKDPLYGRGGARGVSGPARGWARELERRTPRLFLHATELAFVHPGSGERLRFQDPLPPDLAEVAAWARAEAGP